MLFFIEPFDIVLLFVFEDRMVDVLRAPSFEDFEDFVLVVTDRDVDFVVFEIDFDEGIAAVVVLVVFVVVVRRACDDFEVLVQAFVLDPCGSWWRRRCHETCGYRVSS